MTRLSIHRDHNAAINIYNRAAAVRVAGAAQDDGTPIAAPTKREATAPSGLADADALEAFVAIAAPRRKGAVRP